MAGSEAEERIRAKAVAWLEERCPEARIIHELVLEQGGSRIDLAAVTPDMIVAVEIKSERDVLDRLNHQLEAALKVADHVVLAASPCKVVKLARLHERYSDREPCVEYRDKSGNLMSKSPAKNPDYVGAWPRRVRVLIESETGFIDPDPRSPFPNPLRNPIGSPRRDLSPWHRLWMLWASELQAISNLPSKREVCAAHITETMTGGDIRRAVCAALRQREFPRADPPVRESQWA